MDALAAEANRKAIRALKTFYRTGRDDLSKDFFTPCLRYCVSYKRAAGYFSSSALKTWSGALVRLLSEQVTIQLLICPELSVQDAEALKLATDEGYRKSLLSGMSERLIEEAFAFENAPDDLALRLRLMAWMIVAGYLDIRFAMPRHIEDAGIFHEKSGIFGFPWGERIAFVGSANESHSGHIRNYEKVVVFRDWVSDDASRVSEIESDFELQWSGEDETLLVMPLSDKSVHIIRTRAPSNRPEVQSTVPSVSTPKVPALDSRWRHQAEATKAFISAKGGILEMATGTGKTKTALRIAHELLIGGQIESVIVCTEGTDLLDQWFRTIVTWDVAQARALRVFRHYGEHHQGHSFSLAPKGGTDRFPWTTQTRAIAARGAGQRRIANCA